MVFSYQMILTAFTTPKHAQLPTAMDSGLVQHVPARLVPAVNAASQYMDGLVNDTSGKHVWDVANSETIPLVKTA